ncbi:MAG: FtsX-like permease family protein [Deltaproteobacteria bacterium]|nr:FtsX-like permease family protein [Deltaproteobacteria bacterium]MCW5807953.1 FtsX-like permease family protein [Deltaproteobacteria bacterium]
MWNLARKLLLHDRLRFAVAIAGVSVSVMLVLVQVGLYFGFMDTASSLIDASRADLWVGKKGNESFEFATPFDERAFYKVASVRGVRRTERVLMNFAQFKLADGGDLGVQVVGIETVPTEKSLLAPWNVVDGDARRLSEPGAIVIDRSEYAKLKIDRVGHQTELSGVHAEVVAMTSGIRSFTTSPIVFADMRTARSFLPQVGGEAVTYVLVQVEPGEDVDEVKARINALPHLAAYTTKEMSDRTRSYWSSRTGVGAGFFTTAVLGIIVGFVVVGQILYSGTLQYIREYGTLKAMGARNSAVVKVILSQAMISAALGFVVGGVMAVGMKKAMAGANLTVALTPELYGATAVITAVMCSFAALLSIVKVLRLDPASVFKT